MNRSVVRHESPEEQEYARYLDEIEIRKLRVAAKRADLEALRASLGRFEAEYHARVGVLFVELDQVKLAIEEYERRIWLLQSHRDKTLDDIEREINESFSARRDEIRDEEETTRRYEEQFERQQQRPLLESGESDELKWLYRDLAKRFHPDLARTETERQRRAAIMQQINLAFQERDLVALRGLGQASEFDDPAFERKSIGEKLVWAIREVARLDGLLRGIEEEETTIKLTSTFKLWQRAEAGEAVIEQLIGEIESDLGDGRNRLAILIGTYRSLLEVRVS